MFDNVGAKLKTVAMVLCILGLIASVIGAIALWVQDNRYVDTIGMGVAALVCGCAGSLIGGMLLYGFGQLIENSDTQVEMLRRVDKHLSALREESRADAKPAAQPAFVPKTPSGKRWKCNECGYDYNVEGNTGCAVCGARR